MRRVINLLKNWMEKYWKDFIDDPEMSATVHAFIQEDINNSGMPGDQLLKSLERKVRTTGSPRTSCLVSSVHARSLRAS